jgi:hypothetical protein
MGIKQSIQSKVATSRFSKPLLWFYILLKTKSFPAHPSQEEKYGIIASYAKKNNLKSMVETGTYKGEAIKAVRDIFDRVFSIELDPELFAAAEARFSKDPQVTILQGDSAELLPQVLKQLTGPTLFWLDGHWSGGPTAKGAKDTPIMEELEHILSVYRHPSVILIDDARCFLGRHDYPTVSKIKSLVKKYQPGLKIKVKRDIIRIFPK